MSAVQQTMVNNSQSSAIRVMVVDDSVVVRTVIERILNCDPAFQVVHKTNSAEHALDYLAGEQVDLVLLDIELPGQSGLVALPAILRANPQGKVVILSGNCDEGSAAAMDALALGASDICAKPGSGSYGEQFPRMLIDRLSRLAASDVPAPAGTGVKMPVVCSRVQAPIACLGIGASTGGIHALGKLFAGMSAPLGVPILVTQHLPASFTSYFTQQMGRMTPLRVKVAEQGETVKPNIIYVAPGDASLQVRRVLEDRVIIALNPERTAGGYLPGVDPMFVSMADAYGKGAAGIVLTGMGRDGTAGARNIVAAGGWIVAQNEASSVVWGMPGSVASAGLSCALLEPGAIMDFVARRGKSKGLAH